MASLSVSSDPNQAVQLLKQSTSAEVSPSSTPASQTSLSVLTSNAAPKFGTIIPNRIFVGGIPANTNEQELKSFFCGFGQVKDAKIINDRAGVSKGYGFVTFEAQDVAEKIIKSESENLVFKDRKLNIGQAIRKQQMFPRSDVPGTVFFTNTGGNSCTSVPYTFQNGMAVFHMPGQDGTPTAACAYPTMLGSQYAAAMMVPQPAVYVPQTPYAYPTSTAAAATGAGNQWATGAPAANGNNAAVTAAAAQWPRWAAPQSPPTAALHPPQAPPAYFSYSPTPGDFMYIQGGYTPNSTSDYSSDTSHTQSIMETTTESESSPARNMNFPSEMATYSPQQSAPDSMLVTPSGAHGRMHQPHLWAASPAGQAPTKTMYSAMPQPGAGNPSMPMRGVNGAGPAMPNLMPAAISGQIRGQPYIMQAGPGAPNPMMAHAANAHHNQRSVMNPQNGQAEAIENRQNGAQQVPNQQAPNGHYNVMESAHVPVSM